MRSKRRNRARRSRVLECFLVSTALLGSSIVMAQAITGEAVPPAQPVSVSSIVNEKTNSVVMEEVILEPQESAAPQVVEKKPAPSKQEVKQERPRNRKVIANCSAYTADPAECGGNASGITASGRRAVEGRTVAMDDVPLGTRVRINGKTYVVEDRFGGGYSNRVDIYMNNKSDAINFGRQNLEVEILD